MTNLYKSYYLCDLLAMIDRAAIDCMMAPTWGEPDVSANVAYYNDGIKDLVEEIRKKLLDEAAEDGRD